MFVALQGFTFEAWNVFEGTFPESVDAADGWLVSGSKHGAYEDHDWIPPLEDFIRASVEAARPIVGVCFGHKIIAQALSGTVAQDLLDAVNDGLYDPIASEILAGQISDFFRLPHQS